MACDYVGARTITVVTTSSGRAVWRRAFSEQQIVPRTIGVYGVDKSAELADVCIASWGATNRISWHSRNDVVILDESHYAKHPERERTIAVYGKMIEGGAKMLTGGALVRPETPYVWALTGTPASHDLGDLWCMLRALAPEKLEARDGLFDVMRFDDFRARYCIVRMKKISNFNKIPVVIGNRNEAELKDRIGDFMLRRTQADVGIQKPRYETLPMIVSDADRRRCDGDLSRSSILEAAEAGKTDALEMQLGPLRRITGEIKAHATVAAVAEEFESGLDKIVLMYFHRDVGDILEKGLSKFGPLRIDGSTPAKERERAEVAFRTNPANRVMVAQIQAAGEAISLAAASVLDFVETTFSPREMAQAALRITDVNKKQTCFVRVRTLEGSIDDSVQASLLRLWAGIKQVIK